MRKEHLLKHDLPRDLRPDGKEIDLSFEPEKHESPITRFSLSEKISVLILFSAKVRPPMLVHELGITRSTFSSVPK